MPFISRKTALSRLRDTYTAATQPIIGAGAGTGISAKFAERGGVDLIIIYNSGRFRMAGRGSLAGMMPYGDANAIVVGHGARSAAGRQRHAGAGRRLRHRSVPHHARFLRELQAMGFDGVQNFPTVGLIDGSSAQNLEETGMSYDLEVDMIAQAHELDLLTCPYVFDADSATRDGQGRRRRPGRARGPDHQGLDRRQDARCRWTKRRSACRRCTTRRAR